MYKAAREIKRTLEGLESLPTVDVDRLKVEINTLLHRYLPGNITINESEALALGILDIVMRPKEYLTGPPVAPRTD